MIIPRIRIAHLPTPIEQLSRLSAHLGGPIILVKRDDLTGLAFGGNKIRKLEFVLAEAVAVGARTLITVGAVQSNHCRQTAALAAQHGLNCILVLSGEPEIQASGNYLLDQLFGTKIVWSSRSEREVVLKETFNKAWADGLKPYLIPLGASNPLGTLGYAYAFEEFMQQNISADWIVVASSSGGTQAGLEVGSRRSKWNGKILGISIDEPASDLQHVIAGLASEASDRLGQEIRFEPKDILVDDHYLGEGYGILGKAEIEAIRLFSRLEGLLLDPVYTGRAAAGLIDLIQKGYFKRGESVLFWHTGGTPALFADKYAQGLQSP
jgi:D-cysteine desulfhydrase family pyridoxal phosphate-dependent enzyme